MKRVTGGSKKPVAKRTAVTKSRGSKTAKQMGDMNARELYNERRDVQNAVARRGSWMDKEISKQDKMTRAGGSKNLSSMESKAKANAKGVANKPKGSLKKSTAKPKITKSRGSKTAKQMGDMNEREGYNMYARSQRTPGLLPKTNKRLGSKASEKINSQRQSLAGPGKKKAKPKEKVTGYRYGDHPPQGARMYGSTYNSQHTPSYYDFSNKKDNSVSDRVNDYVSKRRAGGGKNLSPFEGAAKASSKGVANKPKGSLKSSKSKAKPKGRGPRGR